MTTLTRDDTTALEAKIDALTEQVSALTAEAREQRALREQWQQLAAEAGVLGPEAMAMLTERLAELDRKGYFDFASATLGVVDEIVTHFSEEDVTALGENVVLILNVVKEMTQPEIMAVVQKMIAAVDRQRVALEAEPTEPPSLWALARKVRTPEVRRGMDRALATLGAVSDADAGAGSQPDLQTSTRGGS